MDQEKYSNIDDDNLSELGNSTVVDFDEKSKTVAELPKTYPEAWLALFLLVLLRAAISVFQFTYSVVPTITSEFFHVSFSAVNWLANIQTLIYVLVSFFTGWIFQRVGVKRSLVLAGVFNFVGSILRSVAAQLSPPSYALTMIGQIIGSASAPFALNIMTMFTATWFTDDKRATAGVFVASNYGAIIGMFMIPKLTTSLEKLPGVVHIVSGIACIALIPLIFMPPKPPTPPSSVAALVDPPSFSRDIRLLVKNYNYWIIFMVHGLNIGLSVAFSSIFTQIISPYGYTDIQAGQMNAVGFFAGTLGCSVAGPILDLTKQHKLFLRLIAPMVFITDIGFIFIIQKESYAAILFVLSMNQFFLSFLVPVAVELGSETSYPVADATTNSILWQGSQVFGFLIILIMDLLRDTEGVPENNMTKALIFQAGLAGLSMVFALSFSGRMIRTEAISKLNNEKDTKGQEVDLK